jgi:cold shock CspA family protein
MNFDFGRVEKYKPKGFGFVRSFFHEEYFFHIKKITDKNIQKYLDNNKDN